MESPFAERRVSQSTADHFCRSYAIRRAQGLRPFCPHLSGAWTIADARGVRKGNAHPTEAAEAQTSRDLQLARFRPQPAPIRNMTMSWRWEGEAATPPVGTHRTLTVSNPSPVKKLVNVVLALAAAV